MINKSARAGDRWIRPLLYLLPILGLVYMINYTRSAITSAVLIAVFLVSFAMFLIEYTYTYTKIFVLCINVASLLITGFRFAPWGSILQYMALLMMALVLNSVVLRRKTYATLHTLTAVILTAYVFTARIPANLSQITDIFGNRINPNMLAIFCLAGYCHWRCALDSVRKGKWLARCLDLCAIVLFGYRMIALECRSVLLVFVMFLAASIVFRKPLKYSAFKTLVVLILLASLLFVFFYLGLYQVVGNRQILGKSLFSGRQIVWGSGMDLIREHFFFGCGNDTPFMGPHNTPMTSSHNTLLGLWKILGIIPMLTFIFLLVSKSNSGKTYKVLKTPQLIFLCTLVICVFESFYTEAALFVFYLLFLPMRIEVESE